MCGFFGILSPNAPRTDQWLNVAADTIRHRGPDDSGIYIDQASGIHLAHRRLSILDLSSRAHQPMVSQSGRYVIAYNGEIYNHLKIRGELCRQRQDLQFRSTSDTETILEAIERWGIDKTLAELNGMFAFALWDTLERCLYLARDRIGEKPLYLGWINGAIVFSSELKPLLRFFSPRIAPDAIPQFLSLGYVPAPGSILNGVFKLPPANYIRLSPKDCLVPKSIDEFRASIKCYWSLQNVARSGTQNRPITNRDSDSLDGLQRLLGESVRQRMLSDVPLGACLSGGIDSSLVVALMQESSRKPIKTYNIGFSDPRYDESRYARQVAEYIGTDHFEVILEPRDALDIVPELPQIYDEPFADVSQLPTVLVSKMLRQHVKVALSGDGGDELFFGYERYFLAPRLWRLFGWIPFYFRQWAGRKCKQFFTERYRIWRLGQRLLAPDFDAFYLGFASIGPNASLFLPGSKAIWEMLPSLSVSGMSRAEQMMYRDQLLYLPDDILVKVDRASMASGLEMRAPFLDHRVVESAWLIGLDNKMRDGRGKWILRRMLNRYLPESLFERPKQGFGIPIDEWLRGSLKEWAEHLLSRSTVNRCPGLEYSPVRQLWDSHQAKTIHAGYLLWNILMLLAWFEEWRI